MPPNYTECETAIPEPGLRGAGVGFDRSWEPLEGFQCGDKLMTPLTRSRTDPAPLQSCPSHLLMRRRGQ